MDICGNLRKHLWIWAEKVCIHRVPFKFVSTASLDPRCSRSPTAGIWTPTLRGRLPKAAWSSAP